MEPPGSQASWNARDQHMATTLLRIKEELDQPGIIVWAHNSHLGDCTACPTGGSMFEHNDTWNLGQMTRNIFGQALTHIVGFYTHHGTVLAAHRWGGAGEVMKLQPALPGSLEDRLHKTGLTKAFINVAEVAGTSTTGPMSELLSAIPSRPLNVPYVFTHPAVNEYAVCTSQADPKSSAVSVNISRTFTPTNRVDLGHGVVRLETREGFWVTELKKNLKNISGI